LALAAAAHAVQPGAQDTAFLQADETPMEKVPVVGEKFKVNPVSTSMQCVISLTIQYMLVYTALALCRTAADVFNIKYDNLPIQDILKTATYTVNFAPMLAILFLGCRMRVTWLTQGKGNPPEYVQAAMYCATYAVLMMTLCVCVIPLFTGKVMKVDVKTGDIPQDTEPFTFWPLAVGFTILKYLIMLGLYAGALVVVYGIINFEPPKGTWPGDQVPPVSPAVQCVMILTCQYFLVYGGIQVCKTVIEFAGDLGGYVHTLQEALDTATLSINFAPMLAVLFIGARMRALQMDPVNGKPQTWAQNCFFMCTYALALQTALCVVIPVVLGGKAKPGKVEGDMEFEVKNTGIATVLTIARFCITICIYIGFSCVIWSVFTIEHPAGPQYTPPISVTMKCVINLTVQFFVCYLGLWIAQTARDFLKWELPKLKQLMENAKSTIMFCPMLAILFVGTRMRALLITNNRGAPQGWVQDGMYMATWAVLIQFLMVLFVGLATAQNVECDEDGTPKWEPAHPILVYVALGLKWITFIFLYGGVIAVIVGVYTMTPETANGRGSIPLAGDGKIPGTDVGVGVPGTEIGYKGVGEPVGADDLPGMPKHGGPRGVEPGSADGK